LPNWHASRIHEGAESQQLRSSGAGKRDGVRAGPKSTDVVNDDAKMSSILLESFVVEECFLFTNLGFLFVGQELQVNIKLRWTRSENSARLGLPGQK
jgi:hypothetical protein